MTTSLATTATQGIDLVDGELMFAHLEGEDTILSPVSEAPASLKREALRALRALPEWDTLPLSLELELY